MPITFEDIRRHLREEKVERGLAYPEVIDGSAATPVCTTADAREWLEGELR